MYLHNCMCALNQSNVINCILKDRADQFQSKILPFSRDLSHTAAVVAYIKLVLPSFHHPWGKGPLRSHSSQRVSGQLRGWGRGWCSHWCSCKQLLIRLSGLKKQKKRNRSGRRVLSRQRATRDVWRGGVPNSICTLL